MWNAGQRVLTAQYVSDSFYTIDRRWLAPDCRGRYGGRAAVTDAHQSGEDSSLDRRTRSIRVTDPSHATAAGRRTGGIDTVSRPFDTVASADSRVTTGLPTDRGSFAGLLGFGLARYGSPVTLTFRHPRADGVTDTPFDSSPDGPPDVAVSTAAHDRSAVVADQERSSPVADTTLPTVHRLPPRSRSTTDPHHPIAQLRQSTPQQQQQSTPKPHWSQQSTTPRQHSTTLRQQSTAQPRQPRPRSQMTSHGEFDTQNESLVASDMLRAHYTAQRSTDSPPPARPPAQYGPTQRVGSQRPGQTTLAQSTVRWLSLETHSQPSVSPPDSAQPVVDNHTASSATAGRSVGSQRADRRLQRDLRYRSVEQNRPSHFSGPSEPTAAAGGSASIGVGTDTTDGTANINVEYESHTQSSHARLPRRTVAAGDRGHPSIDAVQPLHNSQSNISVGASTGWSSTADHPLMGSQWRPTALSSPSSVTRELTTQPAERITAGTADSGPPLRVVGTTPASARASGLSTVKRRDPVPEQFPQEKTRQPRRVSDSYRSIHPAVVSGRPPAITPDAARSTFDHGRPERDYTSRSAATTSAQRQASGLSTMRVVSQSSRTTPTLFTARTADQSPTNTFGPLTEGGVGSLSGTGIRQIPSTVSTLRLPATESPEPLPRHCEHGRSGPQQSSGRWYPSSSAAPARVVDLSVPVASMRSRGRVASSGIRRSDSDRVFVTADRAVPSDQKRSTTTATTSHDHSNHPANTVLLQPERPAVSGRRPTNSQRRRSRKHTRTAVFSSTLHTRVQGGSAGAPTTDAPPRFRSFSGRLSHPRSPRRGLAGSAAIDRVDRPLDSSAPLSQQSRQLHRLQPSTRSWPSTDSRSAATDLQRQPEPMRSGLASDRHPHQQSPFPVDPLVASGPPADPRNVDSVRISRWPVTAVQPQFNKLPRQRAAARSQSTRTVAQPPAGASDRSWPTHDTEYTGGSPATVAPTLADGVSTDSRRPTLSRRFTRPSPPLSYPDSVTVHPRRELPVSTAHPARSRPPTGLLTGLEVTPETTAATTAQSRPVVESRGVPSSAGVRRFAPAGWVDSPATDPSSEIADLVAGSAPPTPPRRSLRQPPAASRHRLGTVRSAGGSTTGASGSTASRPVGPRQQSIPERGRSTDRPDRHQLLSPLGRQLLRSDTELPVSIPQTTGIDHTAISLDAPSSTPTTLASRSPSTDETDVDRSRLPTRQDVAGRSVAPDSPPTTLSWLSQPIDRSDRRSRQSTAARGESEPAAGLSESTGFVPRRSAGGLWHTDVLDPSSRPRHRNRSDTSPHPAQSSSFASVSQHFELLRSDAAIADGTFTALDQPFKKSTDTASDLPLRSTGWSWRSRSANGVRRAVAPRGDSSRRMTPRTHALSRLDSGSSSFISAGSTPMVVDREPSDTDYDASVLSVAAASRTDTGASDPGRRPDDTTGDPSRVDVRRRLRSVRSWPLTHATEAESSAATEPRSPNAGRKQPPTDESDGETVRPRLTFKNPPSQRESQAVHDAAGGRGTADRHHRRERSTAADARAGRRETPHPQSDRQDRTARRSDPFEPVDRPDRQPTPTPDRESVGRSADARGDTGRRSHGEVGDSISGASLAYDADVDRVVETLYRRLERKLRIERERTGF